MEKDYLKTLLGYFKEGKITQYVIEKELTNEFQTKIPTSVKIVPPSSGHSGGIFGIAYSFSKDAVGPRATLLLDEHGITSVYTPDQILEMAEAEIEKFQDRYKKFTKTLTKYSSPSLKCAIRMFLDIYRDTLINIRALDLNDGKHAGLLPQICDVEKELERLDDDACLDSIETIIERITVSGVMPAQLISDAKSLCEYLADVDLGGENIVVKLVNTENLADRPHMNLGQQEIQKYCNGPFSNVPKSYNIKHNYLPSTNQ